jgi:hypothetical protein
MPQSDTSVSSSRASFWSWASSPCFPSFLFTPSLTFFPDLRIPCHWHTIQYFLLLYRAIGPLPRGSPVCHLSTHHVTLQRTFPSGLAIHGK